MTRMWRGPSESLKAAESNSLWAAIHRRGGRHLVACDVSPDGRSADFYRLQSIKGDWFRFDLGRVEGETPFSTVLAGYRRFTPLDAELLDQNVAYIEQAASEIDRDCLMIAGKLSGAVDSFTA